MAESENGKGRSAGEEPLGQWEEVTEGGHSLDEVARGLATGALSRRQALKMAAGALLGSALGIFSIMNPAQARRRRRRRCIVGNIVPGGTSCPSTLPCLIHLDTGTVGCCLPQNICETLEGLVAALDCTCGAVPPGPPPPSGCPAPCPAGQCCNGGTCADQCDPGEICVAGDCVAPPPAPSKCAGVTCPGDDCCNPSTGECISPTECAGLCNGACVGDICDVSCPSGQCCQPNQGCVEDCGNPFPCCNAVDQACVDACPDGSVCEQDFCTPDTVLPTVCPTTTCPEPNAQCIDPVTCECVARSECDTCCFPLNPFTRAAGVCVEGCSENQQCSPNVCVPVQNP